MRNFTAALILLFSISDLFSQPAIISFSPTSGTIGTTVTIKGTGFSTIITNNTVYFGTVKAVVSASTDTTIIATVPAGATYQPITVTTNNLTAYSANSFVVTYSGGAGVFSSTSFIPKVDFTTGMYPHCVLLADFNQDNKNDIMVSRGSSSNVSILSNTSSGNTISFGSAINIPATGNNHEGGAIADFDGDGKLDFVITNSNGSNSVSVFRNTTAGSTISFAAKIDYPSDNSPYSVAAGDLDGDGRPDLVIGNNGASTVTVYKNQSTPGNISFISRVDLAAGTNPYSVAIGDLNADGKPDVAITTQGSSSSLAVMKNNSTTGTISLGSATPYAALSGSFIVAIGDLDNDGKPDLAAASSANNSVVVLRNTSTGTDISFLSGQQNFTVGIYPVCVSIGDLDGDGRPDLITANRTNNNISCLRNNTTTSSGITFDNHIEYAVNTDPFYVAVGDLDGDARPDIISANSAATNVSVLRNIIGANVAPVITSFTPTSGINGTQITILGSNFNGVTSVKFGGVDASSFTVDSSTGITAIVGTGMSGNVSVTTAYGTATLAGFNYSGPIISSFSPVVGVAGSVVTITGINLNGATSVKFGGIAASSFIVNSSSNITATVGSGASGNVSVTTSNGTATLPGFSFGPPTITSVSPLSGEMGSVVTISGTNFIPNVAGNIVFFGAVKATILSATSTQLNVVVPADATYQPVSVTVNNLTAYSSMPFNSTFISDNPTITTNSFSVAANYGTGGYPYNIAIEDLNDDSKPDVISVNGTGNTITALKNASSPGTIAFNRVDFGTGINPKGIAIGDLDGDGKPDMVVTNFNSGGASSISILRNTSASGNITFATKEDYSSGNGSLGVSVADMNADGKPDIIVASGNSGFFSIFKNTTTTPGIITLGPKEDFSLSFHGDQLTTADLDKDGLPDIIITRFSAGNVSIFRNASSGGILSLSGPFDYSVGTNPTYVTTGDLNNDGKLDILVSNYSSGTLSLLKNNCTPGFISFSNAQNLNVGVSNISLADLNGDGKPDLTTGRGLTGAMSVFENTYSSGNFSFGANVDFITGNYDTFVGADDLDGDGKPEIAVANTTQNTISILKNNITMSAPAVTLLSATSGLSESTVTINGNNFTGITAVKFGGIKAGSFILTSSTKIDAKVVGGASGDVTVTNAAGTGTIAGFNFIPEITAGGDLSFCNGGSVSLSSTAAANNQWYKDGIAINGATGTTFSATTSGSYTVKTTSNGITTTSPVAIGVFVTVIPTPTITRDINNQLVSSAATGNQWYLNGSAIAGATGQSYQPTQNGSYSVKATANGCTSDYSTAYNFILTAVIDLGNDKHIKIFPNPVQGKLFISWNFSNQSMLNIRIYDLWGTLVQSNNNLTSGSPIDFSSLAQGVYLMKIYNSDLKINKTVKIIKQNQ